MKIIYKFFLAIILLMGCGILFIGLTYFYFVISSHQYLAKELLIAFVLCLLGGRVIIITLRKIDGKTNTSSDKPKKSLLSSLSIWIIDIFLITMLVIGLFYLGYIQLVIAFFAVLFGVKPTIAMFFYPGVRIVTFSVIFIIFLIGYLLLTRKK